jgi:hypothetical protein
MFLKNFLVNSFIEATRFSADKIKIAGREDVKIAAAC